VIGAPEAATVVFEVAVATPAALVTCRQQAAGVVALAGFGGSARTRLVTAVAELSRAMLLGCTEVRLRCLFEDAVRSGDSRDALVMEFSGRRLPGGGGGPAVDQAAAAAGRLVDRAESAETKGELVVRLHQALPRPASADEVAGWRLRLGGAGGEPAAQRRAAAAPSPADPTRQALAAAGAGLWSWTPGSGGLVLDDRAQAILCGPDGEFAGTRQAMLDLVHPDDAEWVAAALEATAAERRPLLAAFRVLWPDGAVRHVELRGGPLDGRTPQTGPLGGLCLDVTDQVSQQLLKRHRERQRLEAVGELAGSLAHEINNLLQPIIGLVDMARDDQQPGSPLHDDLGIVLDSARDAATIIRDVLIFARPVDDAGRLAQPLRDCLVVALRFVRSLQPPAVTIDGRIASPLPGQARLDANDLRQVLTNLVTNAAHAMGGAGVVRLNAERLPPAVAPLPELPPGDYVEIRVSDSGCGIDPAIHALIFEPFFTTKAVGQGTGLGLSVVFGMIRGCGGAIAVDSVVGQGTTFRLYVPVSDG
jgi:signal transduction histidine kinase